MLNNIMINNIKTNYPLYQVPSADKAAKYDPINVSKPNEKDHNEIGRDLGKKVDVRNATFEEMCEVAKALYEAGEISGMTYSVMTLDTTKHSSIGSVFLTPEIGGKRDWIAEYTARASITIGHMESYTMNQNILNILFRLECK